MAHTGNPTLLSLIRTNPSQGIYIRRGASVAFCYSPKVLISVNVSLSGNESNKRLHIMGFKKKQNKNFLLKYNIHTESPTAGLKQNTFQREDNEKV